MKDRSVGNDREEIFLYNGDVVLDSIEHEPGPDILKHFFHEQVKNFHHIEEELLEFRRAEMRQYMETYSYTFLWDACDFYIKPTRQDHMKAGMNKGVLLQQSGAPGIGPEPKAKSPAGVGSPTDKKNTSCKLLPLS